MPTSIDEILALLLVVSFLVMVILAVPLVVLQVKMLSRLRSNHATDWERLGSPTLILNNTIGNTFSVLGFLWKGEYMALHDGELSRTCKRLRLLGPIYFVATLVAMISMVKILAF